MKKKKSHKIKYKASLKLLLKAALIIIIGIAATVLSTLVGAPAAIVLMPIPVASAVAGPMVLQAVMLSRAEKSGVDEFKKHGF